MALDDVLSAALHAQNRPLSLAPTTAFTSSSAAYPAAFYEQFNITLQTRSVSLGYNPDFNASALLAQRQQHQLQVIAATFSSVSIIAAFCAIFWFCMMRRNFRRDLVLLLIIGDFWKSTWFLVFSITTLATGHVFTGSNFCQATGYFLQLGLEACDFAILLMSLHMMLQIFPPKSSYLGADGLYRIRYYVLVGWFVVPNAMTSIAFSNTGPAFISQGGFCSLPIRPIWFRLALSWIPRYIIWIFVMGVAIRIYRHVGYEFKVFGQENDQTSSVGIPDQSPGATSNAAGRKSETMQREMSSQSDAATLEKQPMTDDDIAPDDDSMLVTIASNHLSGLNTVPRTDFGRRQSVPNWASPFGNAATNSSDMPFPGPAPSGSRSMPSSRRGSRQTAAGNGIGAEDFAAMPIELTRPRGSVSTTASRRSGGEQLAYEASAPGLAPITEHTTTVATAASTPGNVATRAMQGRRKAIQRQLRLLFIYPVMYLLLWIFPFINHSLNYSNYYAQHPIFALSVLNIFCQNIMGFCDVCIFCWREKPWRHIPASDGTFLGSFLFWRYCFSRQWIDEQRRKSTSFGPLAQEKSAEESSQRGLFGSIKCWSMSITGQGSVHRPSNASVMGNTSSPPSRAKPPMHRRTRSGGSDRRILQAEQAQERLARERADYEQHRRSLHDRRASVISISQQQQQQQKQQQQTQPERKEWWDRHMSIGDDPDHGERVQNTSMDR